MAWPFYDNRELGPGTNFGYDSQDDSTTSNEPVTKAMHELDQVFERLSRSPFRARFRLRTKEREYLKSKGLEVILEHGRDFIEKRLAAALPKNDGKQTPMGNHPVFVAQHATGTCCRGCLEKWHGDSQGTGAVGGRESVRARCSGSVAR